MIRQQFVAKLNTILSHNAIPKHHEKEKSGKINSKRLGRAGTTDRLFVKPSEDKLEREYTISILVDCSGSMDAVVGDSGVRRGESSRLRVAEDTVCELAHALDKIRGVNYEIVGFNSIDIVYKSYDAVFDEKLFRDGYRELRNLYVEYLVNKKTGDIFDSVRDSGFEIDGYVSYDSEKGAGENHDGLFLYRSYKRILGRRGKKTIVVFSDGEPTVGSLAYLSKGNNTIRGDKYQRGLMVVSPSAALRMSANLIKQQKEVTLLGIGIGTDYVKNYYHKWVKVSSVEDFFPKTISLLSKVFKKV